MLTGEVKLASERFGEGLIVLRRDMSREEQEQEGAGAGEGKYKGRRGRGIRYTRWDSIFS